MYSHFNPRRALPTERIILHDSPLKNLDPGIEIVEDQWHTVVLSNTSKIDDFGKAFVDDLKLRARTKNILLVPQEPINWVNIHVFIEMHWSCIALNNRPSHQRYHIVAPYLSVAEFNPLLNWLKHLYDPGAGPAGGNPANPFMYITAKGREQEIRNNLHPFNENTQRRFSGNTALNISTRFAVGIQVYTLTGVRDVYQLATLYQIQARLPYYHRFHSRLKIGKDSNWAGLGWFLKQMDVFMLALDGWGKVEITHTDDLTYLCEGLEKCSYLGHVHVSDPGTGPIWGEAFQEVERNVQFETLCMQPSVPGRLRARVKYLSLDITNLVGWPHPLIDPAFLVGAVRTSRLLGFSYIERLTDAAAVPEEYLDKFEAELDKLIENAHKLLPQEYILKIPKVMLDPVQAEFYLAYIQWKRDMQAEGLFPEVSNKIYHGPYKNAKRKAIKDFVALLHIFSITSDDMKTWLERNGDSDIHRGWLLAMKRALSIITVTDNGAWSVLQDHVAALMTDTVFFNDNAVRRDPWPTSFAQLDAKTLEVYMKLHKKEQYRTVAGWLRSNTYARGNVFDRRYGIYRKYQKLLAISAVRTNIPVVEVLKNSYLMKMLDEALGVHPFEHYKTMRRPADPVGYIPMGTSPFGDYSHFRRILPVEPDGRSLYTQMVTNPDFDRFGPIDQQFGMRYPFGAGPTHPSNYVRLAKGSRLASTARRIALGQNPFTVEALVSTIFRSDGDNLPIQNDMPVSVFAHAFATRLMIEEKIHVIQRTIALLWPDHVPDNPKFAPLAPFWSALANGRTENISMSIMSFIELEDMTVGDAHKIASNLYHAIRLIARLGSVGSHLDGTDTAVDVHSFRLLRPQDLIVDPTRAHFIDVSNHTDAVVFQPQHFDYRRNPNPTSPGERFF